MIPESTQELAALYVFDLLEPAEARAFEAQLERDSELRQLVDELRGTAATLAHRAPLRGPSVELENRILSEIRAEKKIVNFPIWQAVVPWAIAAALAIFCGVLFLSQEQLKVELAEVSGRDPFANVQAFALESKFAEAPGATAVVVWDPEREQGVIKLTGVPAPKPGEDYQLWIIDPQYKTPVDGGIIPIRTDGISTVSFRGDRVVSDAEKFAISLEKKGGVPVAEGPIVMISN